MSALAPLQKLQNEPVRLRTVELGAPVHYADHGGRGPPLVMLHGLGGSYRNWLPAAPLLAHHARVLALDLIGFGRTPEAGRAVGVSSQREMLHRFITEVVGRPAVLVGNSWGGLVSLAQAALAEETVAGLVRLVPFAASRKLAERRPDWCFEPLEAVGHVPQMEEAPRFVERVVRWMVQSLQARYSHPG